MKATLPTSEWWNVFADEKLNALISRAQSQSMTLLESYERIIEARANHRLQGGQLLPNGNLIAEYAYNKRSQNAQPFVAQNGVAFNLFNLGIDSAWELDLFGKIRRSIEAADAEVRFQENDFEYIRQTLLADIAASYIRIRLLQGQVNLVDESIAVQVRTAQLVFERGEAGVSTDLDRRQTESFRHRSLALLASLKQDLEIEFNQLAILIGQAPDIELREFVGVRALPMLPPMPEAGVPADVIRRRPDVSRDEMAVRAASARIGIAEADLYPQLSLLGSISVSSKTVSSLFETGGLGFSVGPSFRWNILQFNRINNNIEIQESKFRQAIARYKGTVLAAVREVEDGLIKHDGLYKQWNELNLAIESDKVAVALSLQRYKAGKANFQRALDAQQQLLDDRQLMVRVQAEATTQLIRIYKAAGGGWANTGVTSNSACGTCDNVWTDGLDQSSVTVSTMPQNTGLNFPGANAFQGTEFSAYQPNQIVAAVNPTIPTSAQPPMTGSLPRFEDTAYSKALSTNPNVPESFEFPMLNSVLTESQMPGLVLDPK